MKNRAHVFQLLALGLIVALQGTASGQGEKKPQTSVRFKSGLTVFFTSETEPPGSGNKSPGGSVQITAEGNTIHRVFVDSANGIYFGYDLEVTPLAEPGQFRLTVKPLTAQPGRPAPARRTARGSSAGGGQAAPAPAAPLTRVALPNYPAPQLLQDGDTLALDVLVNPRTGVKIVDLIKVVSYSELPLDPQLRTGQPAAGGGNRAPADLTPDAIEFRITASRLLADGQAVFGEDKGATAGITGALVWFYLPGHGRFILSLVPRAGYDFRKIGVVSGDRLSFTAGGRRYEWISSAPIVTIGSGTWNLWVLHDPDYRPEHTPADTPFLVGGAERVEHLIKKN